MKIKHQSLDAGTISYIFFELNITFFSFVFVSKSGLPLFEQLDKKESGNTEPKYKHLIFTVNVEVTSLIRTSHWAPPANGNTGI